MKSKTETERWYLGDGVSRIVEGGTSYLIVKIGDFPEEEWNKWEADCKIRFGGCRWNKMMNDHERSKICELIVENKFSVKQQKEEPKKEFTLGGEEII